MFEILTIGSAQSGQIGTPLFHAPLEDNFFVNIKDGYEEFVGFISAEGIISTRDGRAGVDLSQPFNVELSDRVISGPEWTMCWWVYPENLPDWHNFCTSTGTGNANTMLLQYNHNTYGGYFMINYPSGTSHSQWYRTKLEPTIGVWNHFAMTWKNNTLTSYKNGEVVSTVNTRQLSGFGTYNLKMDSGSNKQGTISNWMFFDKELNESQVKTAMAIYKTVDQ